MRAVARDTGGAIAVMTALVMPVLIGVAAYAIDASLLLYRQERLQVATDIGALAGAELLRDGRSDPDVIAFARAVVAANMEADAGAEPEITVTVPDPTRIEIAVVLDVERIFSRLFGTGGLEIFATSAAVIEGETETPTCLYVDDASADEALFVLQGTRLKLTGCDVAVESTSNRSVLMMSGTALVTDCLTTRGRVAGAERVTSNCPDINQRSAVPPPRLVPSAPLPSRTCTGSENAGSALARFQSGDPSCGRVEINGNVNLVGKPYFFMSRGDLFISDSGSLTLATGSVLVLMDNAKLSMNPRAELAITAPSTGSLAGVAIVSGPARQAVGLNTLGQLDIEGLIALPGEDLLVTGRTTADRCTRIHAKKLTFNNGARFNATCDPIQTSSQVRLVPNDP